MRRSGQTSVCSGRHEERLRDAGYRYVAGTDEAGRGALCGPVYAAAVILPPHPCLEGLADSKVLTAVERERLARAIQQQAVSWALGAASASEIDRWNIYAASRLAMRRAVEQLQPPCDYLLVDALSIDWPTPQEAIVRGDAQVACIAAASILAKVARDRHLEELGRRYPGYHLERHKGYPTPLHRAALARLGPCPEHRRSYAPVREAMLSGL